jgi:lysine 6-dehydrogenase
MKKKILLLGYGKIGKYVYDCLTNYDIDIVDNSFDRDGSFGFGSNRHYYKADFSNLQIDLSPYDVIIGCVPAKFGYKMAEKAISCGKNYVDLSFCEEDIMQLNGLAIKNNCILIPDTGLAPGLTNLFVGNILKEKTKLNHCCIFVGGVAKSPFSPYGYAVTWSLEDLRQEFLRPAKHIVGGKICTGNPFDNTTVLKIKDVSMEAFLTDGLRTLLSEKDNVGFMAEYTLRWPGHISEAKRMIGDGTFIEELLYKCSNTEDTVVFHISADDIKYTSIIDACYDNNDDLITAMAQTTGLACCSFVRLVLEGYIQGYGVITPEQIGRDQKCFDFIINEFKRHGIWFDRT